MEQETKEIYMSLTNCIEQDQMKNRNESMGDTSAYLSYSSYGAYGL